MLKSKLYQPLLLNGGLLIVLVLVTIAITYTYVSSEHAFYWWDYVGYQDLTKTTATTWLELPNNVLYKAIKMLYATWRESSLIPTLPLFPFVLIFGDSRLVYILSSALLYLLPFALVLGAIAVKLIPSNPPRAVFWSAALLTLLTPVAWAPTLRGFPDTGGALLIALATLVYLPDLQKKQRWQLVLVGCLIAAAALFRRPFVYSAIAFFVAIALQTLINFITQVRRNSSQAWRYLFQSGVRLGWIVGACLITLATLGLPFIAVVVTNNFGILFTSYEATFSEGLRYYCTAYGWIGCLLAGLGFAAGIRTRVLNRPAATFIILFGSFSLLQWLIKVKELSIHYTLHFTPLILLGLTAFGWTVWSTLKGKKLILILSASGIYLLLNAVIGLASADVFYTAGLHPIRLGQIQTPAIVNTELSELFSANYSPLKRTDYDEVARLVKYLRSVAPNKQPIFVAASSPLLNYSILENAEKVLYKSHNLKFLHSPDVDSRDFYPLENLLQAQYVAVATPFQHHIRAEEQDVVKVVVDAFTENWSIAHDFTPLPVQFALEEGTVVKAYKRSKETSLATALNTLVAMQNYIGARPGGQSDWISLNEVPGHVINRRKIQHHYWLETSESKVPETSFMYINPLPEQVKLTGNLVYTNNSCKGASLQLKTIDRQGKVINSKKIERSPQDVANFTLPMQTKNAAYLVFNISVTNSNNSSDRCAVKIEPLSLKTS